MHFRVAVPLAALCGLVATGLNAVADDRITVVSSRADTVSGGDVLLQIRSEANKVRVTLNGKDISGDFHPGPQPNTLLGLVDSLRLGSNTLHADGAGDITLVNHPISGPVFSGAHEQPFYCMTSKFPVPGFTAAQANLGSPLDVDCSIATRVDYVYRSTSNTFKPFTGVYASDLVTTTTTDGKTVPYIVRVETGTINRGIYQTAVLHNPSIEPAPTPLKPPSAWNRRLVYTFGGGCVGGWYIQGTSIGNSNGVLEDLMLRQGYGVASNTLNVFSQDCNDVIAAETMSMTKERFIKNFGPVKFTIGFGCSAGSEQAQTIADGYPGLEDGIVIGCTFADPTSTLMYAYVDSNLFLNYLAHTSLTWTDAQKLAATGMPTTTAIADAGNRIGVYLTPRNAGCNAIIPTSTLFNATTNPTGVRCDFYDHNLAQFGADQTTGYARRTFDNTGVQYGLDALNAGQITKQQFIDLNQNVGGLDNNGAYAAARSVGDLDAIRLAYRGNRVLYTGFGMRSMPIINYRAYMDYMLTGIETHQREQEFMTRARLLAANGNFDNQVIIVEDGANYGNMSDNSPLVQHALTQMDQWITNLQADVSNDPIRTRLNRAKPADLVEACFINGGTTKVAETQVYMGNTICNQYFPAHTSPRGVAGWPLANNVLKCRLKALDPSDYTGVTFTPAEIGQLMAIFPNGVCDWTKPGIAQQRPIGTWISYLPCPNRAGKDDDASRSIGGVAQCSLAGDGDDRDHDGEGH